MNASSIVGGAAWIDRDGKHVWCAHDCSTGRVVTMLPWPQWHSTGLEVDPSVACDACGFHTRLPLGPPDADYRCMDTWEFDGRRCERARGHSGAHQNGFVSWAVYTETREETQ